MVTSQEQSSTTYIATTSSLFLQLYPVPSQPSTGVDGVAVRTNHPDLHERRYLPPKWRRKAEKANAQDQEAIAAGLPQMVTFQWQNVSRTLNTTGTAQVATQAAKAPQQAAPRKKCMRYQPKPEDPNRRRSSRILAKEGTAQKTEGTSTTSTTHKGHDNPPQEESGEKTSTEEAAAAQSTQ
ncbi:uncharacterized protein FIBRA_04355 [Fibroporia radiculosa]|uniref:Uncharacterized protein n=1 Tax=Fibroporia radiculosa TaxID=599839 RepID=J4GP45_9APHY|nr:uncharacterized protein FIBRA_04355 [Fibroporia radiculosa]CCM02270.1 predicted protein [Fibroporia radiculosa]